jgi:hypothetical protein
MTTAEAAVYDIDSGDFNGDDLQAGHAAILSSNTVAFDLRSARAFSSGDRDGRPNLTYLRRFFMARRLFMSDVVERDEGFVVHVRPPMLASDAAELQAFSEDRDIFLDSAHELPEKHEFQTITHRTLPVPVAGHDVA